MKALTIKQPWAHLIIHGGKDIENRDWQSSIRGRIAVHSSARLDLHECRRALLHMATFGLRVPGGEDWWFKDRAILETGSIIGTVEIVGCVNRRTSPWFAGEYGFMLQDPIPCDPFPIKGRLGFWEVPPDVAARIAPLRLDAEPVAGGGVSR